MNSCLPPRQLGAAAVGLGSWVQQRVADPVCVAAQGLPVVPYFAAYECDNSLNYKPVPAESRAATWAPNPVPPTHTQMHTHTHTQVKEYVPPPPEADVAVPTNMSVEQLRAAAEAKRAALENWCRTAYGEVGCRFTRCSCLAACC